MESACAIHLPFLSLKGLEPPGEAGSSTAGPCAVPWTCPFMAHPCRPAPGAKPGAPGKRDGGTHVHLTSCPEQGPRKPMEGQSECWPLSSSLGSHALLLLFKEGQQALQAGPCWKLSRIMEPGRRKGMLGSSTQRGERLPSPPRVRLGTGQTAPAVLTPPPPPHRAATAQTQGSFTDCQPLDYRLPVVLWSRPPVPPEREGEGATEAAGEGPQGALGHPCVPVCVRTAGPGELPREGIRYRLLCLIHMKRTPPWARMGDSIPSSSFSIRIGMKCSTSDMSTSPR